MAEIWMVDGRGLLIAGVGHVLNAAMMLSEAASEIWFFFWFFFCLLWSQWKKKRSLGRCCAGRHGRVEEGEEAGGFLAAREMAIVLGSG
jgi:hypothetical protein